MKTKKQIAFVDMDGVLADFVISFQRWFGMEEIQHDDWGGLNEQWNCEGNFCLNLSTAIDDLPALFWENLPLLEDGRRLMEKCLAAYDEVYIVTHSSSLASRVGKAVWLSKHFGGDQFHTRYVKEREGKLELAKELLSQGDAQITIWDDNPATLREFGDVGELNLRANQWLTTYNAKEIVHSYSEVQSLLDLKDRQSDFQNKKMPFASVSDLGAETFSGNDGFQDEKSEAQKRKETPMYRGLLAYFPLALAEVSRVSLAGHKQHADEGEDMRWYRDRSMDQEDALIRHLADHSVNPVDDDGLLHLGKVAWRALAALQIELEKGDE